MSEIEHVTIAETKCTQTGRMETLKPLVAGQDLWLCEGCNLVIHMTSDEPLTTEEIEASVEALGALGATVTLRVHDEYTEHAVITLPAF